MITVRNLTLRGTPRLNAAPGKKPFVFLAYAEGTLVIPTLVGEDIVELEIAFQSVALRLWENGFDISFPSSPYTVTIDGTEETRYSRKVRPANRETRVELERVFKRDDAIAKLVELGREMLANRG